MKVSELTATNISDYLRLDYSSLTDSEKVELTTFLSIAKVFIASYTGIQEETILDETVGTGDGTTKVFYLDNTNIVPAGYKIYIDDVEKTINTDYTIDTIKGKITFLVAPADSTTITADYSLGLDAFDDFVIAIYVLCQDMFDNRVMYIDKNNMNKVVETILNMHSTNLL